MKPIGYTLNTFATLMLTVLLLTLLSNTSYANENNPAIEQTIKIGNAVMPAVPPVSRTAAVYLTIKNLSDKTITLDTVHTEIAKHAMFHQSTEKNGVAKMQHLDKLVIPAKQSLNLLSGGIHIMLMGLKDIPKSNQFQLFLGNTEQTYQVTVKVLERNSD